MTNTTSFAEGLAEVTKLWNEARIDEALARVEILHEWFPGNPKLLVMWASLVQLQEESTHSLDEARRALQEAVELDDESPAAILELAHFVDSIDDDPFAAAELFEMAAQRSQDLLIKALQGQLNTLRQLDSTSLNLKRQQIAAIEQRIAFLSVET